MALNNVTIDYNRLETFHPAWVDDRLVDVFHPSYPLVMLLYKAGIAGGLDGISQIKDWNEHFIHGRFGGQGKLIGGRSQYECGVELEGMPGEVTGPGLNTIDNTPRELYTKARWGFNHKYQPISIPSDEWAYAKSAADAGDKGVAVTNLLKKYSASGIKAHLKSISDDIFGTGTNEDNGVLSLKAGIGTSASDTTTYGNLSRNTYNVWRGNYATGSAANWRLNTSTDFGVHEMGAMIDTVAANGANMMDLVIVMGNTGIQSTRQAYFGGAASGNTAYQRFQLDSGRGIPYASLYFDQVPIIHDPNCGTKDIFLIDTKTTFMIGVSGWVFKLHPWNLSETTTSEWSRVETHSNVIVTKPNCNYYYLLS